MRMKNEEEKSKRKFLPFTAESYWKRFGTTAGDYFFLSYWFWNALKTVLSNFKSLHKITFYESHSCQIELQTYIKLGRYM